MIKKILINNDDNLDLYDLDIEEKDFNYTKYYTDNLPCMYNYLDGGHYESFEDCVQKLKYDYKKNPTFLSIHLNRLLDTDNPLIVSDALNKLISFVPPNSLESCFKEGLLEHFSIKNADVESKNILLEDYIDDSDDSTIGLVPVSMEDIRNCFGNSRVPGFRK